MRSSLRLLPLALFLAACGGALSAQEDAPSDDSPSLGGSGGVGSSSGPSGSSGFTLLQSSDAHKAAVSGMGLGNMGGGPGNDGHSLGYVPAPVDLPQTAPQYVTAANFPSVFDLRNHSKVGAMEDQGTCGSCWTFASTTSAESSLMPNDPEDFSEDHLNNLHGFDIPPCMGGNHFMAIAYMSRWTGPVSAHDAPYTGIAHSFSKPLAPIKHLTEAYILPPRTGPLDNDGIKSAVTTYGAVYTTMNWQSANYNSSTTAYYHPGPVTSSNHAVTIVGWDDDFSVAKFPIRAPVGPGAFLIKNSWGTGFGNGGYFFVSYYDVFMGHDAVVFRGFDPPNDYAGVYQYDKLGETSALAYPSNTTYSGNVFNSTTEAGLLAVGFYTTAPATSVTISVYDTPGSVPSSGTLVGSTTVAEPFAGYHTVTVSQLGLRLHVGRKFSVSVGVTNGGTSSYVPVEAPFPGYSSKVTGNVGAGYVSADGKAWTDSYATWRSNVPIKAFYGTLPNCDDKNACTIDAWDGSQCTHTPAPAGFACRPKAGDCDVAEVCDGQGTPCGPDAFVAQGTECRPKAGDCDVAEACTGKAAACPTNAFLPSSTVCRPATGACDAAEHCGGASAACPKDAMQPKGIACRASAGPCDLAESCNGVSNLCPTDVMRPAGYVCSNTPHRVCDGTLATCK